MGSRASTGNTWKLVDLAWLLLLFPSSPAVRNNITCKAKQTTQTINFFFLPFLDLFSAVFLPVCFTLFQSQIGRLG
jgi:hypothetical protein